MGLATFVGTTGAAPGLVGGVFGTATGSLMMNAVPFPIVLAT